MPTDKDWFSNPAVRAAAEEQVLTELSLSGAAHDQAVCLWIHAYGAGYAAAPAAASYIGGEAAAEPAGYHSTELSDISSIITWLHAQNKPMGELLRRFFNDATRGKRIAEYNDINPLPSAVSTSVGGAEPGGWVPVGERLPEVHKKEGSWWIRYESDLVLAVEEGESKTRLYYYIKDQGWRQSGTEFHGYYAQVTHWQPLPTPPTHA